MSNSSSLSGVALPGAGLPASSFEADDVRFFVPPAYVRDLATLPWQAPLESWAWPQAKLLAVKSGLSRHLVRFVEVSGRGYAVKETTVSAATREYASYGQLISREIPTLRPIGVITRDEGTSVVRTAIGAQAQRRETGYLVTALMDNVVPDSLLFKRGFKKENRHRIWDAVIQLFVCLHSNGVYWGDASLANMLVNFRTELVPELGKRTRLAAILADAETVEVRPSIADGLRVADVEFFLESMLWTEADLLASGVVRDPLVTKEDQEYLVSQYHERYKVGQETRSFELVTHIDVDKLLGSFDAREYGRLLLQHINEHKWYLSEREGREVPLVEAAEHWYREIFKPVCSVFHDKGLLSFFPEKTASSLYVEIMEHKYFMSQNAGRDVGLLAALEDYLPRTVKQGPLQALLESIAGAFHTLFGDDPGRGMLR